MQREIEALQQGRQVRRQTARAVHAVRAAPRRTASAALPPLGPSGSQLRRAASAGALEGLEASMGGGSQAAQQRQGEVSSGEEEVASGRQVSAAAVRVPLIPKRVMLEAGAGGGGEAAGKAAAAAGGSRSLPGLQRTASGGSLPGLQRTLSGGSLPPALPMLSLHLAARPGKASSGSRASSGGAAGSAGTAAVSGGRPGLEGGPEWNGDVEELLGSTLTQPEGGLKGEGRGGWRGGLWTVLVRWDDCCHATPCPPQVPPTSRHPCRRALGPTPTSPSSREMARVRMWCMGWYWGMGRGCGYDELLDGRHAFAPTYACNSQATPSLLLPAP